jgi:hypothetical protein
VKWNNTEIGLHPLVVVDDRLRRKILVLLLSTITIMGFLSMVISVPSVPPEQLKSITARNNFLYRPVIISLFGSSVESRAVLLKTSWNSEHFIAT